MNAESCKKGIMVVQVRAEVNSDDSSDSDGEKGEDPG